MSDRLTVEGVLVHLPEREQPSTEALMAGDELEGRLVLRNGTTYMLVYDGTAVAKVDPDGETTYWSEGRQI